jgi:hypothetical protein
MKTKEQVRAHMRANRAVHRARNEATGISREGTKRCLGCGLGRPRSDFYINRGNKDGLDSWCKLCRRRALGLSPIAKRSHPCVRAATPSLNRPDACEQCGRVGKVDAHHPDYARPLEVMWLCRRCHFRLHARLRKAAQQASPLPCSEFSQGRILSRVVPQPHSQPRPAPSGQRRNQGVAK